jgi:hypothetical protein
MFREKSVWVKIGLPSCGFERTDRNEKAEGKAKGKFPFE